MSGEAAMQWWRGFPDTAPPADRAGSAAAAPASRLAFGALLLFLFILLVAPQNAVPALAPLRLAFVAALTAIGAHLGERFVRRRPLSIVTRELVLMGCLVGWAVVTLPLSYWPGGSLGLLLEMYFKSAALLWLIANVVDSEARLARVAAALSLMSVPAALTALHNYAAGVFVPGSSHARISGYGAPLTENPNDLALLLNLVLPLTVVQLLQTRGRPGLRALLQAVLAVQVAGIVVTFSRSGFLTLALSLALLAARHARRGRWGVPAALAVAVLVALPLVPGRYLDRISTLRAIGSDPTGSAQARWDDAVAAAGFVAGSPLLGAGAGMNVLALNEARGDKWRAVHNVYLEYAVDLGVPGLALFLALLFSCLAGARAGRRAAAGSAPPARLAAVSEGLEIALLAFALAGMFHPVAYQFYFHLVAGLAVAARRISSAGAGSARGDGREPHRAVLR